MSELLNLRGLSPEVNNLSEFVVNAIDLEQRKKSKNYYMKQRITKAVPYQDPKSVNTRIPSHNKEDTETEQDIRKGSTICI